MKKVKNFQLNEKIIKKIDKKHIYRRFIIVLLFVFILTIVLGVKNDKDDIAYNIFLSIVSGIIASFVIYLYENKILEAKKNFKSVMDSMKRIEEGVGSLFSSIINVVDYELSRIEKDKSIYDKCISQIGNSIVKYKVSIKYGKTNY